MNKNNFTRILDANINRTCEGVRVVEDIVRFHYIDENLTERLRILRHRLRNDFSIFDDKLIFSRDSVGDIGKKISEKSSCDKKKDLKQVIRANFKRISESLRSIEEITKINDYPMSKKIETYRYE
ncbi:MAG TPA: hypothetical protein PLO89_05735, partial [Spirochaetota bacterium]|nr:hypothetical protein [Spirochaetota bacterium]